MIEPLISLSAPLSLTPFAPVVFSPTPVALPSVAAHPKVETALPWPRPSCKKTSQISAITANISGVHVNHIVVGLRVYSRWSTNSSIITAAAPERYKWWIMNT